MVHVNNNGNNCEQERHDNTEGHPNFLNNRRIQWVV